MAQPQQFVQGFYDSISNRDMNQFLAFFNDDAQFRVMSSEDTYRGKNEIREMAEEWLNAFPDGKFQVQKVFGSGDSIGVETTFVGTHQGPLQGPMGEIPATGKRVNVPASDMITLKNGKIQSINCYMAGMVMMSQIGAMPQQKAA
jgi:steroid delta-isomerase-like uncharacterized protein